MLVLIILMPMVSLSNNTIWPCNIKKSLKTNNFDNRTTLYIMIYKQQCGYTQIGKKSVKGKNQ